MRQLEKNKEDGEEKRHHPFSISSPECFDNYDRIQRAEFLSTMLAVHLSDKHLSPCGFFMLVGSRPALFGDRVAAPLEHVAKSTVMQQAINLSVNKIKEDLVYENSCMAVFVPDRLAQERNAEWFKKSKHDLTYKKEWVPDDAVVNFLKYYAHGEQRPANGTYF